MEVESAAVLENGGPAEEVEAVDEQPQQLEPAAPKQIYIVRLPRPEQSKEEASLVKLQEERKGLVAKLRALSTKHQAKRVCASYCRTHK